VALGATTDTLSQPHIPKGAGAPLTVYPIQQGLAELVAYFSIAVEDRAAVIDDASSQTLTWLGEEGTLHRRRSRW
jgi:hypothetical protein